MYVEMCNQHFHFFLHKQNRCVYCCIFHIFLVSKENIFIFQGYFLSRWLNVSISLFWHHDVVIIEQITCFINFKLHQTLDICFVLPREILLWCFVKLQTIASRFWKLDKFCLHKTIYFIIRSNIIHVQQNPLNKTRIRLELVSCLEGTEAYIRAVVFSWR